MGGVLPYTGWVDENSSKVSRTGHVWFFLTPKLVSQSGQGCLTVQLTSFLQRCSGCFIIYAADAFVMNVMLFSLGSRAVCYFNICIKYIAKYCTTCAVPFDRKSII